MKSRIDNVPRMNASSIGRSANELSESLLSKQAIAKIAKPGENEFSCV